MKRRSALKLIGASTLALSFKGCFPFGPSGKNTSKAPPTDLTKISPIDRSIGDSGARSFSGDNPSRAHAALWNKSTYLESKKTDGSVEKIPLVVIGGGMSGLLTSFLLKDLKPIVLEQAPRFGGNARGESWRGIDYALGAAYFMKPEEGSAWQKLLTEIGADKVWRVKTGDDPVAWQNKIYNEFWEGSTAPKAKAQFKKLAKHFADMNGNQNGLIYPDIPTADPEHRKYIDTLDRISLRDYVQKVAGEKVHPHLETVLEHYCWSTFGSSSAEISAASGLNNFAAEFAEMVVLPGGNAHVAELALKKLNEALPSGSLRASSLVIDVKVADDGVHVLYENELGELKEILAQSAVMACPKFVVGKVLSGIEPERASAISKLKYRSYLVGNVLLNGVTDKNFYDLFMLHDAKINFQNIKSTADSHQVTDVVLGTFAKASSTDTVLTLYRGLPFDGARGMLYADTSYEVIRAEFEKQIKESILPLMGFKTENVVDVRLTRWGHPMPVSSIGYIADGVTDLVRKPFANRVFFVEQDNWMLPCIETCGAEALAIAPDVRRTLTKV